MSKLELEITVEGAEKAAAAFEALALAADKAREAIEKLADIQRGDLKIAMAGELMHCEFTISPDETINFTDVHGNRSRISRGVKEMMNRAASLR